MSCTVCRGYTGVSCPCCGEVITCPDCNGVGYAPYMAFNIHTRCEVEVTEMAWFLLPEDEDGAHDKGMNYCKMPLEKCPTCNGCGDIVK